MITQTKPYLFRRQKTLKSSNKLLLGGGKGREVLWRKRVGFFSINFCYFFFQGEQEVETLETSQENSPEIFRML